MFYSLFFLQFPCLYFSIFCPICKGEYYLYLIAELLCSAFLVCFSSPSGTDSGLQEDNSPPQESYYAYRTANATRIALDESVNELCRGGFFFSLLVFNVFQLLGKGRIFLDDTGDQVILLLGSRGVVNACRELLNFLTSAHVLHQVARSGGVPNVPAGKNDLRHARK